MVQDLIKIVDQHNALARSFRGVKDFFKQHDTTYFYLRLFRNRCKDARVYNLPTSDEVETLIVGDLESLDIRKDIIEKKVSREFIRLHEPIQLSFFCSIQCYLLMEKTDTKKIFWSRFWN